MLYYRHRYKAMLDIRYTNLLIAALILLLGVQLTGFTCLGEWQLIAATTLVETLDPNSSPNGGVTDDGCPCHFVFQSVPLAGPDILSLLADDVAVSHKLSVPTFVVFLFHPPLSL